jgi:hypothetical protein
MLKKKKKKKEKKEFQFWLDKYSVLWFWILVLVLILIDYTNCKYINNTNKLVIKIIFIKKTLSDYGSHFFPYFCSNLHR